MLDNLDLGDDSHPVSSEWELCLESHQSLDVLGDLDRLLDGFEECLSKTLGVNLASDAESSKPVKIF